MRVLHIIKGLGLAGAENHLISLLAGLRESDIDASLLLWATPQRPADEIIAAAQAHNIPIERWLMPRHFDPLFFWQLVRHLRQTRPQIVHTHLVHAETYAIPAARLARVPYVVNSSHNDDPFRRHPLFAPRNWLLWRLTDQGIAISEHLKKFLIEVERARPEQIRVIPYGYAPPLRAINPPNLRAELGLAPAAQLIGSVCRLVPQKGLSDALEALPPLLSARPNLHYVIIGDGALREDLRAEAEALSISERVHFMGWRSDAPALMPQFDLFLAPSHWEGFGLVFLEAMAAALPIVSTNVSSIPEVVAHEENGLLVPPCDRAALVDALSRLLNDPDLARQMGAAGQARLAEQFSVGRMVAATRDLYMELTST